LALSNILHILGTLNDLTNTWNTQPSYTYFALSQPFTYFAHSTILRILDTLNQTILRILDTLNQPYTYLEHPTILHISGRSIHLTNTWHTQQSHTYMCKIREILYHHTYTWLILPIILHIRVFAALKYLTRIILHYLQHSKTQLSYTYLAHSTVQEVEAKNVFWGFMKLWEGCIFKCSEVSVVAMMWWGGAVMQSVDIEREHTILSSSAGFAETIWKERWKNKMAFSSCFHVLHKFHGTVDQRRLYFIVFFMDVLQFCVCVVGGGGVAIIWKVWWHQPLFLFIFYIFSYNTFIHTSILRGSTLI
jgi:hypothetical protein